MPTPAAQYNLRRFRTASVKTRNKIRLLAYLALLVSLFLPSKANEMTSHFGEQVKVWEPSIALHLRILFSPLLEWHNYQSFIADSELSDSIWTDMWKNIIYWLPITLTGWLFLLYPSLRRLRNSKLRRGVRYFALVTTALGSGLLIHHLIHWATIYDGYYHMGSGGYFLISAYLSLVFLISIDTFNKDHDVVGKSIHEGK